MSRPFLQGAARDIDLGEIILKVPHIEIPLETTAKVEDGVRLFILAPRLPRGGRVSHSASSGRFSGGSSGIGIKGRRLITGIGCRSGNVTSRLAEGLRRTLYGPENGWWRWRRWRRSRALVQKWIGVGGGIGMRWRLGSRWIGGLV